MFFVYSADVRVVRYVCTNRTAVAIVAIGRGLILFWGVDLFFSCGDVFYDGRVR